MNVLARNCVQVGGQGPSTLLFSHGFGCDQHMWRRVEPAFRAEHRTVLFDLVGAGRSDLSAYHPDKYATLKGYADDLIEICEALDVADCVYVGHSVSAMIGVLAAKARPELFSHLVLICPSPRYSNVEDYVGGFAERDVDELLDLLDINQVEWSSIMSPVVMGESDRATEWVDTFCRTDPEISRRFARVTFKSDHRDDLPGVTVPTLIIDCSRDALSPPEVGRYVQGAIAGSRLTTLDASGHCPHITHPAETIGAIEAFLATPLRAAA